MAGRKLIKYLLFIILPLSGHALNLDIPCSQSSVGCHALFENCNTAINRWEKTLADRQLLVEDKAIQNGILIDWENSIDTYVGKPYRLCPVGNGLNSGSVWASHQNADAAECARKNPSYSFKHQNGQMVGAYEPERSGEFQTAVLNGMMQASVTCSYRSIFEELRATGRLQVISSACQSFATDLKKIYDDTHANAETLGLCSASIVKNQEKTLIENCTALGISSVTGAQSEVSNRIVSCHVSAISNSIDAAFINLIACEAISAGSKRHLAWAFENAEKDFRKDAENGESGTRSKARGQTALQLALKMDIAGITQQGDLTASDITDALPRDNMKTAVRTTQALYGSPSNCRR